MPSYLLGMNLVLLHNPYSQWSPKSARFSLPHLSQRNSSRRGWQVSIAENVQCDQKTHCQTNKQAWCLEDFWEQWAQLCIRIAAHCLDTSSWNTLGYGLINSVRSRCIVKGEAQKSPLFWRFSGGFWFSQDCLLSRNSTRNPLNLIKSPVFTNAPCETACL